MVALVAWAALRVSPLFLLVFALFLDDAGRGKKKAAMPERAKSALC